MKPLKKIHLKVSFKEKDQEKYWAGYKLKIEYPLNTRFPYRTETYSGITDSKAVADLISSKVIRKENSNRTHREIELEIVEDEIHITANDKQALESLIERYNAGIRMAEAPISGVH